MAATLTGHRGKDGGGLSPEETLVAGALMVAGPLGGGNDGTGRRSEDDPNLVGGHVVRRLMPVECERLQALPDDWTLVEWKGKPATDSPRYAGLGDAVTASVSEWIGNRIIAVDREAPAHA